MKKTVVILGHPHYKKSFANKTILEIFQRRVTEEDLTEFVEVRNLIELYPDYHIDREKEQNVLITAENIVLQFPFYWYSVPAILKLWLDDVLSYGFAYGSNGDKLKGKNFLLSFTVGGPKEAYSSQGYNNFEIEKLIMPHIQTSNLIGTKFIDPVYTHGMIYIPDTHKGSEEVEEKAKNHAEKLFQTVTRL